jgi:hypothetical protein
MHCLVDCYKGCVSKDRAKIRQSARSPLSPETANYPETASFLPAALQEHLLQQEAVPLQQEEDRDLYASCALLLRGLRVRIGMATGLTTADDVVWQQGTGRCVGAACLPYYICVAQV